MWCWMEAELFRRKGGILPPVGFNSVWQQQNVACLRKQFTIFPIRRIIFQCIDMRHWCDVDIFV